MEYTVKKLSELSGVSTRTLRYYHEINLLNPKRLTEAGYRIYGKEQVDLLQQILFYRELGIPLEKISLIINDPCFNRETELKDHLFSLLQKKKRLELLIENVKDTIGSLKGEKTMSDKEKFSGFKKELIEENERNYGEEIREKYGDISVDRSYKKIDGMSEEQWEKSEKLREEINLILKKACELGDPASDLAHHVCDLHRQWLCMFWQDGTYSKQAHLSLALMYCEDERFKKYYEKAAPGAAEFLLKAMEIYCK